MLPIPVAGPAVEPVPLAEMKAYLRLDGDDEDGLVAALVSAARLQVEAATRSALIAQSWQVTLDRWPADRVVVLPLWPIIGVSEVAVADADGVLTPLDASEYRLDRGCDPARLLVDSAAPDPAAPQGGVSVLFTAGYGSAPETVPSALRQAIRMRVVHWFEHRGDAAPLPAAMPGEVLGLIAPYRRARLA
jgi:uncharacterized phiE125 gp8 family phage protein